MQARCYSHQSTGTSQPPGKGHKSHEKEQDRTTVIATCSVTLAVNSGETRGKRETMLESLGADFRNLATARQLTRKAAHRDLLSTCGEICILSSWENVTVALKCHNMREFCQFVMSLLEETCLWFWCLSLHTEESRTESRVAREARERRERAEEHIKERGEALPV